MKTNKNTQVKESPTRSIAKSISWRFIATSTTLFITVVVLHSLEGKSLKEALGLGSTVAVIEFVAKIFIYYLHERLWINIKWGRYWKRRAWKKLYRDKHKELNS